MQLQVAQKKVKKVLVADNSLVSLKITAHDWMGLYSNNGNEHLAEVKLNADKSGRYIIYLSDDLAEGCKIEHKIAWSTSTNIYTIKDASFIKLQAAGPPQVSNCTTQLTAQKASSLYSLPSKLVAKKIIRHQMLS